jgi:ParB-like chromosome segregation protein Spo0J
MAAKKNGTKKEANGVRLKGIDAMPLGKLKWVDPASLKSNDYNPNRVFGPEMQLLKISLLEDGWTQPIVALEDNTIVDGFHRWTLGSRDDEVRAMTGGLVPVVYVSFKDEAHRKMSTIRHNRARGKHGVLKMGAIVRSLVAAGVPAEEIQQRLQMEREEFERLTELRGSPDTSGRDSFGKGWIPDAPTARK